MSCDNPEAIKWINSVVASLEPREVVWVTGSLSEYRSFCEQLERDGIFLRLNNAEYPESFWCRSNPNDVARVEDRTFICTPNQDDAGPTNNWSNDQEMYKKLTELMKGCMRGRTMYVVPYLMGPDGSPYSKFGFELTDSLYVVANMRIMARIGEVALKNLKPNATDFVRGIHSIGNLDPELRYIAHFPKDNSIISFNSNYGGNALQGKKCFALRIASSKGRNEGWLAEHMLILAITTPEGKKHYVTGAFPSACGKTNLAMLVPPEQYRREGWKIETVGDDIAWLNFGKDGRLYAINPEAGFFGVAPGTSYKTNPNAMETVRRNTIFTNTALDLDRMTPWWEGLGEPPKRVRDWLGNDWDPDSGTKAAHPNSRFTAPASQCPSIAKEWEHPDGVPISAIIFGGRRARTAPLVYEAHNWQHGTFLGVTMASETTAAAAGAVGQLRRDPMAMLPFIGYHAGDYSAHWLNIGKRGGDNLPRIFHVNWFRTDESGKFIWPGFGDNMRVLEWIIRRVENAAPAENTALGLQPPLSSIRWQGLELTPQTLEKLFSINKSDWQDEITSQAAFLHKIGAKLPKELWEEHNALKARLATI